jgi:hypothetical protein
MPTYDISQIDEKEERLKRKKNEKKFLKKISEEEKEIKNKIKKPKISPKRDILVLILNLYVLFIGIGLIITGSVQQDLDADNLKTKYYTLGGSMIGLSFFGYLISYLF